MTSELTHSPQGLIMRSQIVTLIKKGHYHEVGEEVGPTCKHCFALSFRCLPSGKHQRNLFDPCSMFFNNVNNTVIRLSCFARTFLVSFHPFFIYFLTKVTYFPFICNHQILFCVFCLFLDTSFSIFLIFILRFFREPRFILHHGIYYAMVKRFR